MCFAWLAPPAWLSKCAPPGEGRFQTLNCQFWANRGTELPACGDSGHPARCVQMEAQKVGTASGFKFEVSGSLLETRNLKPETRNVSDFCAHIWAGRREPTSVTRRTAGKMPAVPTGETHCATVGRSLRSKLRMGTVPERFHSPCRRWHASICANRRQQRRFPN